MNNYTALNEKILEELTNFTSNICKRLGKVDTHFLCDIINGIVSNNSIILSDIVRASGMNNIKKGVERLERHLDSFDEIVNKVQDNYSSIVKPLINPRKLYFVYGGDVTKDENTKFENLGYVLDSSEEHKLAREYKIFEIDNIDNANQPINLISDLRTSDMWLYRLADGIKKIINIISGEIIEKLYPKRKPRRRDLFTVMYVPFRMV